MLLFSTALACYTPAPLPAPEDTEPSTIPDDTDDTTDTGPDTIPWTPELVTVSFTAYAATILDTPFGMDSTWRETPVDGEFTYDLGVPDSDTDSDQSGEFEHRGSSAFVIYGMPVEVRGSGHATTEVENYNPDTWRYKDGEYDWDGDARFMFVDGAENETAELSFSVTDDSDVAFDSDAQPATFTFNEGMTHTFSLRDGDSTVLFHLETLAQVVEDS